MSITVFSFIRNKVTIVSSQIFGTVRTKRNEKNIISSYIISSRVFERRQRIEEEKSAEEKKRDEIAKVKCMGLSRFIPPRFSHGLN